MNSFSELSMTFNSIVIRYITAVCNHSFFDDVFLVAFLSFQNSKSAKGENLFYIVFYHVCCE